MIYQLQITSPLFTPEIFRTVLVRDDMTFDQMHELVHLLFDIEDEASHMFTVLTTNGEQDHQTLIGFDYNEDLDTDETPFLEDDEEILSNWFTKIGDQIRYDYEHEGDVHYVLTLENITEDEEQQFYPYCIAAQGVSPDEKAIRTLKQTKKIASNKLIASLNDMIEEFDFLFDDEKLVFDWKKSFETANTLNQLKPWHYLDDNQIFVVQDPITEQFLYCSVIGGGGQEFGLVVYIGEEGLNSLEHLYNNDLPPNDYIFTINSVNVYFSNRDELSDSDYALIKEHGLSFRGKKKWIHFRSYKPGMYPWIPDELDMYILQVAMEQTIELVEQIKNGYEMPHFSKPNVYPLRQLDIQKDDMVWTQKIIEVTKNDTVDYDIEVDISEFELAKLKKLPKSKQEFEFDMFYIHQAIQEQPGERPMFPLFTGMIDLQSHTLVYENVIPLPKMAIVAQMELLSVIMSSNSRPKKLYVTKDIYHFLKPLAKAIDVKMDVRNTLPHMEEFKAFLMLMEHNE